MEELFISRGFEREAALRYDYSPSLRLLGQAQSLPRRRLRRHANGPETTAETYYRSDLRSPGPAPAVERLAKAGLTAAQRAAVAIDSVLSLG